MKIFQKHLLRFVFLALALSVGFVGCKTNKDKAEKSSSGTSLYSGK